MSLNRCKWMNSKIDKTHQKSKKVKALNPLCRNQPTLCSWKTSNKLKEVQRTRTSCRKLPRNGLRCNQSKSRDTLRSMNRWSKRTKSTWWSKRMGKVPKGTLMRKPKWNVSGSDTVKDIRQVYGASIEPNQTDNQLRPRKRYGHERSPAFDWQSHWVFHLRPCRSLCANRQNPKEKDATNQWHTYCSWHPWQGSKIPALTRTRQQSVQISAQ